MASSAEGYKEKDVRDQDLACWAWIRRRWSVVAIAAMLSLSAAPVGAAIVAQAAPSSSITAARPSGATAVLPPALGVWKSQKLGNDSIQGNELIGSFTVTAGEYVTNFHGTLTASAETSCGTGTIKVPGKLKIIHGAGSDEYGNYNLYAVGVINANADPIVQPERLALLHKGKKVNGSVQLSFVWPPRKGSSTGGEINYGGCSLELVFLHG